MTSKPHNIYDGIEFHETPYDKTDKFSVHVPKKTFGFTSTLVNSETAPNQKHATQPFAESEFQTTQLPNINGTDIKLTSNNERGEHKQTRFNLSADKTSSYYYKTPQRSTGSRTSSAYKSTQRKAIQTRQFRDSLYYDERTRAVPKSTITNDVIEEIVREQDLIVPNRSFLENIYKLKDLGLLKNYNENLHAYKGPGKRQYIFNDYHSKSTNNGYSRNFGGLFFNR